MTRRVRVRHATGLVVALLLPLHGNAQPSPAPLRWVLVYGGATRSGQATYSVPEVTRLITHVDDAGRSEYWLCTGAIFLHLYAPSGRVFTTWIGGVPAGGADWAQYVDSLFARGGVLERLDSAVVLASARLGARPGPFPVSIMIPYPDPKQDTLRFASVRYDLRAVAGRVNLAAAYVAEAARRFQESRLRHLRLDGFYWLLETVPAADAPVVRAVADIVHARGLRLLWIPYYQAERWDRWRELGFDEAWLQPNHFFDLAVPATRVDSAAVLAEGAGMGLEVEFDGRLIADPRFANRLDPYFSALERHPRLRQRDIAIYEGGGALPSLSRSRRPEARARYRRLGELLR